VEAVDSKGKLLRVVNNLEPKSIQRTHDNIGTQSGATQSIVARDQNAILAMIPASSAFVPPNPKPTYAKVAAMGDGRHWSNSQRSSLDEVHDDLVDQGVIDEAHRIQRTHIDGALTGTTQSIATRNQIHDDDTIMDEEHLTDMTVVSKVSNEHSTRTIAQGGAPHSIANEKSKDTRMTRSDTDSSDDDDLGTEVSSPSDDGIANSKPRKQLKKNNRRKKRVGSKELNAMSK
jgi:hypothetical protein